MHRQKMLKQLICVNFGSMCGDYFVHYPGPIEAFVFDRELLVLVYW